MDEGKMKTILMKIKAGEKRTESWFLQQCSDAELQEMVENGYLITIPKNQADFMSDTYYQLTTLGRDSAWKK